MAPAMADVARRTKLKPSRELIALSRSLPAGLVAPPLAFEIDLLLDS